jgi:hypothetical protein
MISYLAKLIYSKTLKNEDGDIYRFQLALENELGKSYVKVPFDTIYTCGSATLRQLSSPIKIEPTDKIVMFSLSKTNEECSIRFQSKNVNDENFVIDFDTYNRVPGNMLCSWSTLDITKKSKEKIFCIELIGTIPPNLRVEVYISKKVPIDTYERWHKLS